MTADARHDENFARLIEGGETGTYLARGNAAATFDAAAAVAVTESYTTVSALAVSAPRQITERMAESSGGRYTVRDWFIYARKSTLDTAGVTPHAGDKFTDAASATFEVIGVDLAYARAGYRLILRKL